MRRARNTQENYVVIGDIWTIYAGEMIVGIKNPRAYYFEEQDPRGYNLSVEMRRDPSSQVMIEAMNRRSLLLQRRRKTPRILLRKINRLVTSQPF